MTVKRRKLHFDQRKGNAIVGDRQQILVVMRMIQDNKDRPHKKDTGFFENFSQHGGGLPKSKTPQKMFLKHPKITKIKKTQFFFFNTGVLLMGRRSAFGKNSQIFPFFLFLRVVVFHEENDVKVMMMRP